MYHVTIYRRGNVYKTEKCSPERIKTIEKYWEKINKTLGSKKYVLEIKKSA